MTTQRYIAIQTGRKWYLACALIALMALVVSRRIAADHNTRAAQPDPAPEDMALIPAAEFWMGDESFPDARPVHRVGVDGFWIDKTEVTNRAYLGFCNETNRALPGDFPKDKAEFPVVNVSILDAQAFAKWARKHRLGPKRLGKPNRAAGYQARQIIK